MALTKANLTNQIHESNPNLTKIKAREAVETILKIMKTNLENGDGVLLSGFGKFNVKDKSARKGRNPNTGETMMLGAKRVVKFKPSGKLRQKVNGK
jgi:integration host factor subunit alpha